MLNSESNTALEIDLYKPLLQRLLQIISLSSLAVYTILVVVFMFSRNTEHLEFQYKHLSSFLIIQGITIIGIRLHLNSLSHSTAYSARTGKVLHASIFALCTMYLVSLAAVASDFLVGNLYKTTIESTTNLLDGQRPLYHSLLQDYASKKTQGFGQFSSYLLSFPIAIISLGLLMLGALKLQFEKPYARLMQCLLGLALISSCIFIFQWIHISVSLPMYEWNLLNFFREYPISADFGNGFANWTLLFFFAVSIFESHAASFFEETDESVGVLYMIAGFCILAAFAVNIITKNGTHGYIRFMLFFPIAAAAIQLYSTQLRAIEVSFWSFILIVAIVAISFFGIFLFNEILYFSANVLLLLLASWTRLCDLHKERIDDFFSRS